MVEESQNGRDVWWRHFDWLWLPRAVCKYGTVCRYSAVADTIYCRSEVTYVGSTRINLGFYFGTVLESEQAKVKSQKWSRSTQYLYDEAVASSLHVQYILTR